MNPLDRWIDEMSGLLAEHMRTFERHGYPPGENVLLRATPDHGAEAVRILSSIRAPRALLDFYARVEEISMPDVYNGIFASSASMIASVYSAPEPAWPTRIAGWVEDEILVFGSDGGGAMFCHQPYG